MLDLQGSSPNLQGSTPPPSTPVGVQAKSPTNNITPPPNTVPANQQNLKDVSQYYANVNGTIYNKARGAAGGLDTWDHFLQDAGLPTGTSGTTLKFDTTWTPPSNSTSSATPPPNSSTTPNPAPNSPAGASSTSTGPYSPPNQGTTGVSQGGIIGNLINTANNPDPALEADKAEIKKYQDLLVNDNAAVDSEPIDLSLASGQKGINTNRIGGLISAAQAAYANDLAARGQNIQATTSAGGLNAPTTNPQTGGLVSPSSNTTTGATTSGATNLSSLIGTRTDANGKPNGEYYNTQTGQGFSTPQQLADFVNQQMPGANATAANVFDLLKSGALNGSGGSNSLNPLTQVTTIAQQVLNRQISPSQAISMGGTIPNWASVLNAELMKQSGGSYDQSAVQAAYDSNQTTQTNQNNQTAQWHSAQQQSQALTGQLQPLLTKINPSNFTFTNGVIQAAKDFVGDATYQQAANLLTEIANTYAQVLTPPNGTITDSVRTTATGMINGLASGQSISQVIAGLDAQASAKIGATHTTSTTGSGNNSNNTASIPAGALTIP